MQGAWGDGSAGTWNDADNADVRNAGYTDNSGGGLYQDGNGMVPDWAKEDPKPPTQGAISLSFLPPSPNNLFSLWCFVGGSLLLLGRMG